MTSSIDRLTKAALYRHFSPIQAARLWSLYEMGVSLSTLARATKVLKGLGVNPSNDHEWSFFTDSEAHAPVPLEMYHEETETWIEIMCLGVDKP
jgi:hypothetical protein